MGEEATLPHHSTVTKRNRTRSLDDAWERSSSLASRIADADADVDDETGGSIADLKSRREPSPAAPTLHCRHCLERRGKRRGRLFRRCRSFVIVVCDPALLFLEESVEQFQQGIASVKQAAFSMRN